MPSELSYVKKTLFMTISLLLTLSRPGFSESGKSQGVRYRPPMCNFPHLKANDHEISWCDTTSKALPENNNTFNDVIIDDVMLMTFLLRHLVFRLHSGRKQ